MFPKETRFSFSTLPYLFRCSVGFNFLPGFNKSSFIEQLIVCVLELSGLNPEAAGSRPGCVVGYSEACVDFLFVTLFVHHIMCQFFTLSDLWVLVSCDVIFFSLFSWFSSVSYMFIFLFNPVLLLPSCSVSYGMCASFPLSLSASLSLAWCYIYSPCSADTFNQPSSLFLYLWSVHSSFPPLTSGCSAGKLFSFTVASL